MLKGTELPRFAQKVGFHFPKSYHRVFELGLTNIAPWYFLYPFDEFHTLTARIRSLYGDVPYVPFAKRHDNDDVACFVVEDEKYTVGSIVVVHMYASAGDEIGDGVYPTFWDWFRAAIDDMIDRTENE